MKAGSEKLPPELGELKARYGSSAALYAAVRAAAAASASDSGASNEWEAVAQALVRDYTSVAR